MRRKSKKRDRKQSAKSPELEPEPRGSPAKEAGRRRGRLIAARARRKAAAEPAPPPANPESAPPPAASEPAAPVESGSGGVQVSRVGLVEVDPFVVLAYWEAAEDALGAARRRVSDPKAPLVLRFRDASPAHSGEGAELFDIDLGAAQGNSFLTLKSAFKMMRCELGVRSGDGRFAVLARSNLVQTPRPHEAERYEERLRAVGGASAPRWQAPGEAARRREARKPLEEVGIAAAEAVVEPWGREMLPEDGEAAHAPAPPTGESPPHPIPVYGEAPLPGGPDAPRWTQLWVDAGAGAGPPAGGGGGGGRGEPVDGRGPSGELPQFGISSPLGEFGVSSEGRLREEAEDQVTLELRAEVVIYGRTRPGTRVYLSGAAVPVRGDGTFETRFALPPAPPPAPRRESGGPART